MRTDARHLGGLLEQAAAERPHHPAVEDELGRACSYEQLNHHADRIATRLARWGVDRGDRIGLFLPKCIAAVAAIHGILRAGAAYVPVDPTAPARRGAGILDDAGVKAVVVSAELAAPLRDAWPEHGVMPRFIVVGRDNVEHPGEAALGEILADDAPAPLPPAREVNDLAYILYTSGSTGQPKGVMLSHANAFTFLDWCEGSFGLGEDDRFSSHAPFHFDLSIFDLYASCRHAATLVLIGESLAKDPARLGPFLDAKAISVWYSAPSILALLTEYGGIDRPGRQAPRVVLFAGEVFPIAPLKRLRILWPHAVLWNLYGPTETNVCTALRIPETIPFDRDAPYPIGNVCPPLEARVVDAHGRDVPAGTIGELLIAGPGVMRGYFGRPDLTVNAFLHDDHDRPWYRTGDLVADDGTGVFLFHGRRDRMVKKRGYRIELGEIEAALYRHPGIDRAGVVARNGPDGLTITAFVALKPGHRGSIIALKRHCAGELPTYMVPDLISILPNLPTTSTDKVDYQGLHQMAN